MPFDEGFYPGVIQQVGKVLGDFTQAAAQPKFGGVMQQPGPLDFGGFAGYAGTPKLAPESMNVATLSPEPMGTGYGIGGGGLVGQLEGLWNQMIAGRNASPLYQGQAARQAQATQKATEAVQSGKVIAGPVDASSTGSFFQTALPMAQAVQQATGIPAAVLLAIAANEGATAPGTLAHDQFNYGGVKATPDWQGPTVTMNTREYGPQGWYTTPAQFRVYTSPQEGFNDIAAVLQNARYEPARRALAETGDLRTFVQAVHNAGYATDPAWTDKIMSLAQQAASTTPASTPTQPTSGVNQYSLGLDKATADAFCGPAAALAFAQATGRNPTVMEAMNLAKEVGWNANQGMAGPQSEVNLLNRLGVPATMGAPDVTRIVQEVQAGRPVIIDTPGHYFQITGYNAASGTFTFGDAVGRRAGNVGQTLEGIGNFGFGAPRTAIYLGQ